MHHHYTRIRANQMPADAEIKFKAWVSLSSKQEIFSICHAPSIFSLLPLTFSFIFDRNFLFHRFRSIHGFCHLNNRKWLLYPPPISYCRMHALPCVPYTRTKESIDKSLLSRHSSRDQTTFSKIIRATAYTKQRFTTSFVYWIYFVLNNRRVIEQTRESWPERLRGWKHKKLVITIITIIRGSPGTQSIDNYRSRYGKSKECVVYLCSGGVITGAASWKRKGAIQYNWSLLWETFSTQ